RADRCDRRPHRLVPDLHLPVLPQRGGPVAHRPAVAIHGGRRHRSLITSTERTIFDPRQRSGRFGILAADARRGAPSRGAGCAPRVPARPAMGTGERVPSACAQSPKRIETIFLSKPIVDRSLTFPVTTFDMPVQSGPVQILIGPPLS